MMNTSRGIAARGCGPVLMGVDSVTSARELRYKSRPKVGVNDCMSAAHRSKPNQREKHAALEYSRNVQN